MRWTVLVDVAISGSAGVLARYYSIPARRQFRRERSSNPMKTTIDIADDLLLRAKQAAHRESITLQTLVEEGLRLSLARREQATPVKIEPVVVGGQGPAPDLSWDKQRQTLYGDEGDQEQ